MLPASVFSVKMCIRDRQGLNSLLIDTLGYFCGQAAVISSLSILGSMMAALAVYHIFFKGKGASGEK